MLFPWLYDASLFPFRYQFFKSSHHCVSASLIFFFSSFPLFPSLNFTVDSRHFWIFSSLGPTAWPKAAQTPLEYSRITFNPQLLNADIVITCLFFRFPPCFSQLSSFPCLTFPRKTIAKTEGKGRGSFCYLPISRRILTKLKLPAFKRNVLYWKLNIWHLANLKSQSFDSQKNTNSDNHTIDYGNGSQNLNSLPLLQWGPYNEVITMKQLPVISNEAFSNFYQGPFKYPTEFPCINPECSWWITCALMEEIIYASHVWRD